MTVNQVRYVCETAKRGSMTKAAEQFYISQPALSEQVRALEAELGIALFRRTPRGTELTDAGTVFCQEAEAALRSWETFEHSCGRLKNALSRSFRIGFGLRARSNGLFEPIVNFVDGYPDVSFSVFTDMSENFPEAVDAGRLDIAVGRVYSGQTDGLSGRVVLFPLQSEPQCILMSPEDPLRQKDSLPVRFLEGKTVISGPAGSGDDLERGQLCDAAGVQVARVLRVDDINAAMALVQKEKGYALGPVSFAGYFGVAAVPLTPEMNVALNLICRKEDENSALIRRLRRHLKDSLAGKPEDPQPRTDVRQAGAGTPQKKLYNSL